MLLLAYSSTCNSSLRFVSYTLSFRRQQIHPTNSFGDIIRPDENPIIRCYFMVVLWIEYLPRGHIHTIARDPPVSLTRRNFFHPALMVSDCPGNALPECQCSAFGWTWIHSDPFGSQKIFTFVILIRPYTTSVPYIYVYIYPIYMTSKAF